MDNSFVQAPVNVPKLSGFDKSHQNLLTMNVGTLCPVLCDVLIPGSRVKLDFAAVCQLAPLVSDTFMRVSLKTEAFFVPFRLLAGSFESWFTDEPKQFADFGVNSFTSYTGLLPVFGGFSTDDGSGGNPAQFVASSMGPQSLSDYLGFRTQITASVLSSSRLFSLMPFLAYHRIYHDWYRNSLIQRDVFLPPAGGGGTPSVVSYNTICGSAPYLFFNGSSNPSAVFSTLESLLLADGVNVFSLRQRNFGLDYFTTATPTAQQGSAESISFNTSGATGSFSIAALRAANSLQQFKERNNLAGNLYVEQLYARYGVRPSDGVAQRSLFLGSDSFDVYSKGVYQTSGENQLPQSNYFETVATKYGDGTASGKSSLVRSFEAKEPGYLFVICSLVPRATYSSGIDRKFFDFVGSGSLTDLANPILQNVGPQPIYQSEVNGDGNVTVFGYTDRYAHFKTMSDELHGFMRDGQNLQAFAAQRNFPANSSVTINSAFLQIPDTFLDQVLTVDSGTSGFSAWLDTYFDYKVAQPLAKYSLPSLQDPAYEHGRTIMVNRGGIKL